MQNDLVEISSFLWPVDAHLLKMRLESEGIRCFLFDEETVTMNWAYSVAIRGVKLLVNGADLEKAREIIALDPELETDTELLCPQCGSGALAYEKFSRQVFSFSWLLIGVPLPYPKNKWQCNQCGFRWIADDQGENSH